MEIPHTGICRCFICLRCNHFWAKYWDGQTTSQDSLHLQLVSSSSVMPLFVEVMSALLDYRFTEITFDRKMTLRDVSQIANPYICVTLKMKSPFDSLSKCELDPGKWFLQWVEIMLHNAIEWIWPIFVISLSPPMGCSVGVLQVWPIADGGFAPPGAGKEKVKFRWSLHHRGMGIRLPPYQTAEMLMFFLKTEMVCKDGTWPKMDWYWQLLTLILIS